MGPSHFILTWTCSRNGCAAARIRSRRRRWRFRYASSLPHPQASSLAWSSWLPRTRSSFNVRCSSEAPPIDACPGVVLPRRRTRVCARGQTLECAHRLPTHAQEQRCLVVARVCGPAHCHPPGRRVPDFLQIPSVSSHEMHSTWARHVGSDSRTRPATEFSWLARPPGNPRLTSRPSRRSAHIRRPSAAQQAHAQSQFIVYRPSNQTSFSRMQIHEHAFITEHSCAEFMEVSRMELTMHVSEV